MKKTIVIKIVKKSDYSFLYELLSKRKFYENISHTKKPTYTKHLKFVTSKPYSKWYIIYSSDEKIGSIYLTKQDEIGMHFKEQYNKKIYYDVLENIIKKNTRHRYLININPKNTRMKDFIKNQGFRLIQHTYEISKKD